MNRHVVEMLKASRDEGVEHLVIGAHALAVHGYVRATLDLDISVAKICGLRSVPPDGSRIWPTSRSSAE